MESLESGTIRVVVVDDHDMLRSGLSVFLRTCEDLELVGEATNGSEAVNICDSLHPDVVLMDLIMPEMDGVTAIRTIRKRHPEIRFLVLTSFDDAELVQTALQAGAIGYLLKNVSVDELANAIRAAYEGKTTLSHEAAQALVSTTHRPTANSYQLTGREQEVLGLMVKGLTNIEIAERLTISRFTVKKHVSNILAKLGTASRIEAVALAIQNRLVEN